MKQKQGRKKQKSQHSTKGWLKKTKSKSYEDFKLDELQNQEPSLGEEQALRNM